MADLFSDAAVASAWARRAARAAVAAREPRRVRRPAARARRAARRCGWRSPRTASRSSIFYGPPGTGKTTLARIVAATTGAEFEELSAVSATVKDVREVLARARERLGSDGPAHDPLPRRDPPLQQGAAGRAAARGRGGPAHADRRDDREPVLRGELGAALADAGLRARVALGRRTCASVVRRGAAELGVGAARPSSRS